MSGTAGRRISGSPRSRHAGRGDVAREARGAPAAARSPATSPCATTAAIAECDVGSVWPLRNTWNRATENLFSAWIEKLFDAPLDAAPSWPALHEVLRDRSRNFLFNHLGLGEDEMKIVLSPRLRRPSVLPARLFRVQDGAAVRLLEVLARRRRPAAGRASRWASIQNRFEAAPAKQPGLAASFGRYLRTVADAVHSGTGRTRASDDNTDYYPVPLTQETLRPGTVYADPYGHILMLVAARAADGRRGGRRSSPSTGNPTGRSRASVSGAAISCSRRILRSAAPGSSASGRSCASTAPCGG